MVEKRNARERRRVHAVNTAFVRLRKTIPFENKAGNIKGLATTWITRDIMFQMAIFYILIIIPQRGKRISKVRVLQKAIDYICSMRDTIKAIDEGGATTIGHHQDDTRLYHY